MAWQHGGLGPMQGQANHFNRFAKERIAYGMQRYTGETERLVEQVDVRIDEGGSSRENHPESLYWYHHGLRLARPGAPATTDVVRHGNLRTGYDHNKRAARPNVKSG